MTDTTFKAFRVTENDNGFQRQVVEQSIDDLPPGDVLIKVEYSSLNYKDALSATGNPGVTRQFPHTPGIDAAGVVSASTDVRIKEGDKVLLTGYDLGMNTDGGFAEYVRVPADWVILRPQGLSSEDAMVFGTAGFTAAMCVDTLLQVGISPAQGSVIVTGATGGVGIIAVWLLNNLGFEVVAATGKLEQTEFLKKLGAKEVIDRDSLSEASKKPLLRPQWAAAVDTVGGAPLSNLIKAIQYGGSVACCGMVAGSEINTSVFPFILRGINLLGVDSVELPLEIKQEMWDMIGGQWLFPSFNELKKEATETVSLEQLSAAIDRILSGNHIGRCVVKI